MEVIFIKNLHQTRKYKKDSYVFFIGGCFLMEGLNILKKILLEKILMAFYTQEQSIKMYLRKVENGVFQNRRCLTDSPD